MRFERFSPNPPCELLAIRRNDRTRFRLLKEIYQSIGGAQFSKQYGYNAGTAYRYFGSCKHYKPDSDMIQVKHEENKEEPPYYMEEGFERVEAPDTFGLRTKQSKGSE